MNPKERPGDNPQPDYSTIGNEFEKDMQEYEKPFKEFKYQMNELDRINAEFDELMKIPEIEEYEKDFENGFPFPDDPGRYKRHMEMLIRSCGITPEEFYKFIHDRKNVGMSDPPGHFLLFCKLQKGDLTDAKRSKRGIKNPIQMGGFGICTRNWKCHKGLS